MMMNDSLLYFDVFVELLKTNKKQKIIINSK
jgi:hypothetical protein